MPDIAICQYEKQAKCSKCYRFMCISSKPFQYYSKFNRKEKKCEDFIKIEKDEKIHENK